mgnify:CR=1 FL=1
MAGVGAADNLVFYVNGKKVEARIYPKREFASFTNAQRAKIIELYKKRKETGKQLQSSQHSGVSSVTNGTTASMSSMKSLANSISTAVISGGEGGCKY